MALKKGVCKNFENCTLADNEEVQEVDSSEFRCTECGKELHEKLEPPPGLKKIIISVVAAIILVGGGVWTYFVLRGSNESKEPRSLTLNKKELSLYVGDCDTLTVTILPQGAELTVIYLSSNADIVSATGDGVLSALHQGDAVVTATITPKHGTPIVDSCRVCVREIEHPTPQPKIIEEDKKLIKKDTLLNPGSTPHQKLDGKKPTNQKEKPSTTIYLQWGTLDGSLSYDNDATIKVTKQHTMYLKDAKQSTIVVCPGDELRQCRIRNGILGSFQIISKNGNRESVLDAHENLN